MPKDLTKCRDCQDAEIVYTTNGLGEPTAHGWCRDCYERMLRRSPGSHSLSGGRSRQFGAKERTNETKYGID